MATIRDVAKKAGVSVATVSHVINRTRKVAPETEARVRRVMEELGYQPNAIAQSLRKRTTYVIGILVSDITNPFFATLVRGAEDAALEAGYSVIVCNSDEDPGKEDHYIRVLWQRRVDGMLIAVTRDGTSPAIRELVQRKIPFVFVDRKANGIDADAVLSDNFGGAYQATCHLIERGHKRIGIILGIPGATTTEERLAGYCQALKENDLPLTKELIVWGYYRVKEGQKAASQLLSLSYPPTAIFSTNNLMTLGLLQELFCHNIKIPQEIAVVTFDDLDWSNIFSPPLTVVRQDPYQMGYQSVHLLLTRLRAKTEKTTIDKYIEIRVPTKLIIREST